MNRVIKYQMTGRDARRKGLSFTVAGNVNWSTNPAFFENNIEFLKN